MNQTDPAAVGTKTFKLVGGELCLDFTNTVGGSREVSPREHLNSCGDFLGWCVQAGLLNTSRADVLLDKGRRRSADRVATLKRAIDLREAIYRIFSAVAGDKRPPDVDLQRLNGELSGALGRLRVVSNKARYAWDWADEGDALVQPLGPIARSAAELLTCPHLLSHVRKCEGNDCGWLFLDSTKNHSRRWCVMSDCGNVAKVRRFRLRQRRERTKK